MSTLLLSEARRIANGRIAEYENRRLDALKQVKLTDLLESDSYLLKDRKELAITTLIRKLLDEYFFYLEQELYEDFCRSIILDICKTINSATRSNFDGIDLEFTKDGVYYLVHVSGNPNWGNSYQIKYMVDNLKRAQRILSTNNIRLRIQAVNGCCFGQEDLTNQGDYLKICGYEFWNFISGEDRLYDDIVKPLEQRAKQGSDEFANEYTRKLNVFTDEFFQKFCSNGNIIWEKLTRFDSPKKVIGKSPAARWNASFYG